MRGELKPTILGGLEVGFFRAIQLGGDGRPYGFSTWVDAFFSQDNYGANTETMIERKNQGTNWQGLISDGKHLMLRLLFMDNLLGKMKTNSYPIV